MDIIHMYHYIWVEFLEMVALIKDLNEEKTKWE